MAKIPPYGTPGYELRDQAARQFADDVFRRSGRVKPLHRHLNTSVSSRAASAQRGMTDLTWRTLETVRGASGTASTSRSTSRRIYDARGAD